MSSVIGGVGGAIVGGAIIGGGANLIGSSMAADATKDATRASVNAQMEELNYLKEVDALPRQYREAALAKLGGAYGVGQFDEEGNLIPGSEQAAQQEFFQGLEGNPLYQSIIGAGKSGEEAILRNAAATGGLRSGNVQSNLYQYNTDLKNQALLATYQDQIQGLRGLGNLPGQTENIAGVMGNIGATQAQGIAAQGQIAQQGIQGFGNAIQSGVGNYLFAKGKGII